MQKAPHTRDDGRNAALSHAFLELHLLPTATRHCVVEARSDKAGINTQELLVTNIGLVGEDPMNVPSF